MALQRIIKLLWWAGGVWWPFHKPCLLKLQVIYNVVVESEFILTNNNWGNHKMRTIMLLIIITHIESPRWYINGLPTLSQLDEDIFHNCVYIIAADIWHTAGLTGVAHKPQNLKLKLCTKVPVSKCIKIFIFTIYKYNIKNLMYFLKIFHLCSQNRRTNWSCTEIAATKSLSKTLSFVNLWSWVSCCPKNYQHSCK